jgi:hypothetical protein
MSFLRSRPMHLWPTLIKINDATDGCLVRDSDIGTRPRPRVSAQGWHAFCE